MNENEKYQSGFGNHFSSESEPGVLPQGRNSPQKVERGLYAEQLSGSSFLAPRHENLRTWTYRMRPSAVHGEFAPYKAGRVEGLTAGLPPTPPTQMRWNPLPLPSTPTDFLSGLVTFAINGDPLEQRGCAIHLYSCNASMRDLYFYSADGDFLIVPEQGNLGVRTELGELQVGPGWIAVVPRGVRFQVVVSKPSRGYVCENYGASFRLPNLGPIGSNGLANPRDFEAPVASYEDREGDFQLVAKFGGKLWQASLGHSPLDVVAWHGNYAPYRYNLARFNTVNTVSYDHPDPSIFTVLTAPSDTPGVSNIDFVIFPPRWMVAEDTFRPPYFHRNLMSEWMGLIRGVYDAKATGFVPGGSSLHNSFIGHGPDAETFAKASHAELKPQYLGDTLAFMFESRYVFRPTRFALEGGLLQSDYLDCWKGLKKPE